MKNFIIVKDEKISKMLQEQGFQRLKKETKGLDVFLNSKELLTILRSKYGKKSYVETDLLCF